MLRASLAAGALAAALSCGGELAPAPDRAPSSAPGARVVDGLEDDAPPVSPTAAAGPGVPPAGRCRDVADCVAAPSPPGRSAEVARCELREDAARTAAQGARALGRCRCTDAGEPYVGARCGPRLGAGETALCTHERRFDAPPGTCGGAPCGPGHLCARQPEGIVCEPFGELLDDPRETCVATNCGSLWCAPPLRCADAATGRCVGVDEGPPG